MKSTEYLNTKKKETEEMVKKSQQVMTKVEMKAKELKEKKEAKAKAKGGK